MRQTFGFGSTTVEHAGQYIFPAVLACARTNFDEGRIDAHQLREIEDQCIREVVENQRNAGLTAITDGELRRTSQDLDFLTGLCGVTKKVVKSGHIWQDLEIGSIVPEITGEISYNPEHPMIKDFEFLVSLLNTEETARITIPSPAQLLLWFATNTSADISSISSQLSNAYRETLQHLYRCGCRSVMLRDKSWSTFCDRDKLKRLIQGGINPTELMPVLKQANENALESLPADMERILFVKARRIDSESQSMDVYDLAVENVLGHGNVTAFMADYITVKGFIDKSNITFPSDKGLILGIVDPSHPQLENTDTLRREIDEVLGHISPAWLRISPYDGFMLNRNTYDTSTFTEADQWNKIKLLQTI